MKKRNVVLASVIACFAVQAPTLAHSQQFQKSYDDWSVYTTYKDNSKLCYMVSYPQKKAGNYRKRSNPYVMVTNVNGKDSEISVTSGYPYKKNSDTSAIIDGKTYKFSLTEDETAWFKTDKYDNIVIDNMKKGSTLTVKGTSTAGTYSTDTYSLKGFTNAYNKIKELCKS